MNFLNPEAPSDRSGHRPARLVAPSHFQQDNEPGDTTGFFDLRYIIGLVLRWWWLALLIVGVSVTFAAWNVSKVERTYLSSVLIEVKQQERNVIDVSEVEDVRVDRFWLSTQIELLQSEALAERVINQLQLLRDPYFIGPAPDGAAPLSAEQRRKIAVARFRQSTTVSPVGVSLLIRISFEHSSPNRAAQIANAIAEAHIDTNLSRKVDSTQYARTFLEEQLASSLNSLQDAERALATYAADNDILIVGGGTEATDAGGTLNVSALVELDQKLTAAGVERSAAQTAWQQAQNNEFRAEILKSSTINTLSERVVDLQSEYNEKLAIYKPQFPEMVRLSSQIDLLEAEIADQKSSIVAAQREFYEQAYLQARAREADLRQRVSDISASVSDTRAKSIDYNILRRQVQTERAQYESLLQRFGEIGLSDDLGSDLVQIVDRATPNTTPYKPNRKRAVLIAAVASAMFAAGLIFLLDIFDDKIKSPEDVRKRLGLPILGVIGRMGEDEDPLTELANPRSDIAEAYASICTNLQFSASDRRIQVIQVTSTRPAEGKSVSSTGLALRFAGLGKRVLLIDADMRRPTFTTPSAIGGLAGVLAGLSSLDEAVKSTEHENLFLLSSGRNVPNPSEILGGDKLSALIESAREYFDYIVIDTPPVLGLADAPSIGARVDGTVVVVQSALLRTPSIRASIERLRGSGSRVLGVVLTKYTRSAAGGYGYYDYSYAYGSGSTTYSNKPAKRLFREKAQAGTGSKKKINLFDA